MNKRIVHFVLSTHWDREWYQSFQHYRHRLVHLLDEVLDGLDSGELAGPFTCDGQAIMLEDYLEVRRDRAEQVRRYVREGKLIVGPWFVLPDEWLVSGESLVRNIRLGREVARSLGGEPSSAGWACDQFGHISQLPQILAGFGIRGGFLWRGINRPDRRHIRWRGADGTVLACYLFGSRGYTTYALEARNAFDEGDQPWTEEDVQRGLRAYLKKEAECGRVDPLLAFDGGDHQSWDRRAYRVLLAYAAQHAAAEGYEIRHSTLDAYLAQMLPQADRIDVEVVGELREPGLQPLDEQQQFLIPGVLSSRVWIKQANTECQALLCHGAEPLSVLAGEVGAAAYPSDFLRVAWRWLLENHPHDSICGCSIDQVHEDMKFRFSQCRQIAAQLCDDAMRHITERVAGELDGQALRVTVFNPLARPIDEIVELALPLPADWPTFNEFFGFEPKPAFRIFDAAGREVEYHRLEQTINRSLTRLRPTRFPVAQPIHRIRVCVPLSLPAMGYATLTVKPGRKDHPTRHPARPGLATGGRSAANARLQLEIAPDGSLALTDRRGAQRYERLLTFEDAADIGDGWYHGPPVNDRVHVTPGGTVEVALLHDSPHAAVFSILHRLSVPACFQFDATMTRSARRVEMVIDSRVTLRRDSDRVEIETTVHNTAQDHRLRVLFPTAAQTDRCLADSVFDVVERPIALRGDNHNYRELEVETRPQQSWTAVHDRRRGLAIVAAGLHEATVRDLPDRPIALTLFRATRRTVLTDGEPDGQLPGAMTFRYWIVPLAGEPDRARLCELGQRIAAGIGVCALRRRDLPEGCGDLPPTGGLFELVGDAVLTACERIDDRIQLRLFNPTDAPVEAIIRHTQANAFTTAQPVDFEGQPAGDPIRSQDHRFAARLKPKQILTLQLTR